MPHFLPLCPTGLPVPAGPTPDTCRVTLEQDVHPRGLPPIFFNGFRAMAALQVGQGAVFRVCRVVQAPRTPLLAAGLHA